MDFEVLGDQPRFHPLLSLESYFRNRRRQLQDWEAEPPHRAGLVILFVSVFESIFGWRLLTGAGFTRSIFSHTAMISFAVILIEVGLAKIAAEVAGFFNKKGRMGTAVTFFNLGLLPLLLILPLSLAAYSISSLRPWVMVGWVLLLTKTLGNWRESLEVSFELSKFQSALVIYLAGALSVLLVVLAAYIGFLSTLTQAFN